MDKGKAEHLCQRGVDLERLADRLAKLRADVVFSEVQLREELRGKEAGSQGRVLVGTPGGARGRGGVDMGKGEHRCQRGIDLERLANRLPALDADGVVVEVQLRRERRGTGRYESGVRARWHTG